MNSIKCFENYKGLKRLLVKGECLDGNTPKVAMFWLRCLTEGKEERISEYIDDRQVWW